MQTISVKGFTFTVLFPHLFRPLTEDEYAELKEDIKARGIQKPVHVDEDGGIIDGIHRIRAAWELGMSNDDIPRVILTGLNEQQKRDLAEALNDTGRMRSREEVLSEREKRQQDIVNMRARGASYREIGNAKGISHVQAYSDHKEAVESGVNPELTPEDEEAPAEPEIVIGRDGKKYPAKKPARRKKADDPAQVSDRPKDAVGNVIPPHAHDAFAVAGLFKEAGAHIDTLQKALNAIAHTPGGEAFAESKLTIDPKRTKNGDGGQRYYHDATRDLAFYLDEHRPYSAICPYCLEALGERYIRNRDTCTCCHGRPYVSRAQFVRCRDDLRVAVETYALTQAEAP